jgi:coenzyme F420-0:L-glutamate ligase/coenzyme F420-1:gamma-L-glutamate ligase
VSLGEQAQIRCAEKLTFTALTQFPLVGSGANLAELVLEALPKDSMELRPGDVLVVASKVVSRAEGCFVDLRTVHASERASTLSRAVNLDERLVELVLRESLEVSRTAPGVLIVKNRLGVVCANAGVDLSNARPLDAEEGSGPWALTLPVAPDASAERLRLALQERSQGGPVGVIISDSIGRPFRLGSVGAAIGLSGLPALFDQRGSIDLFGMRLEHTITALADQVASASDLIAGQAAERRGVVHVRGLTFPAGAHSARELVRPAEQDLYMGPPAPREPA